MGQIDTIAKVIELAVKPQLEALGSVIEDLAKEVKALRTHIDKMQGEREGANHEKRIGDLELRLRRNELLDAEQSASIRNLIEEAQSRGCDVPSVVMQSVNNLDSGEFTKINLGDHADIETLQTGENANNEQR